MSDYTTKATVEIDVNGQKAKAELEQQRKLVKELEIAYAKAEASGDKSAKTIHKELNKARRGLKSMQSETMSVADVLRRLDKATPKDLKNALRQLNKELNSIPRGTKAWEEHVQKIRTVKKELENVNASLTTQKTRWHKISDWINKWQTMTVAAIAGVAGILSAGKKSVNAFASMDSAMANTQKFTGMTREQVELLNEEFKKMDTRTSREDLNELAQEAGRLGKKSQEDILGFVRAADKINVALDDLGEGATLTISKLTGIFGDEERLGTERSLLAVGSVINEISQNCAASAPYLAEFTSRMGGVGAQANMTIPQIMAYGAVLDSNNQTVEASATAVSQVIVRMMQDPAKYANVAGIEVQKFSNLLKTDVNGALILFLEKLNQAGTLDVLSPMFADMGENGSRAISALSTLANKIEDVKTRQQEAAIAFAEATSVDKEYNVQNNTVQAGLDKAKKSFNELKVELGEQLMPVMKYMISGTSAMIHVISTVVNFVKNNLGLITTLTATVLAYSVAANAAAIKTKSLAVAKNIATAAVLLFNKAIKLNPIGLMVGAITTVIGLLITFSSKTSKAKSAMELLAESQKRLADAEKEAEASCAAEIIQLDALYNATQNQTLAMEERINAVKKLQQQYPEYFGSLSQEAILAGNAANEYARLRNNILSSAKARARQEMVVENEKEIAKLTREMDVKFKELMNKYSMPEAYANIIKQVGYDYYKFIDQAGITPTSYFISDWNEIIDKYDPQIAQLQSDQKVLAGLIAKDSIDAANNTPGDNVFNPTTDSRFDAENQWRKSQEEIAKASYRNQEVDYEEHQKKMNEIATEYNEKLLKRDDLTDSEREAILDDYHKANRKNAPAVPLVDTNDDRFKAEKEWREREDALNLIAYSKGEKSYIDYTKRMNEIEVDFYNKQLAHTDLSENERLSIQAQYYEAVKKQNEANTNFTLEQEKQSYNKRLAEAKQFFIDGQYSIDTYNEAVARIEEEHLAKLVTLTKEGTQERMDAEKALADYQYQAALKKQQETKKNEDELKRSQEKLKEEYFGDNAVERMKAYDNDLANLAIVYEAELKATEGNAEEKLRIEEAYEKAKLALKEKYGLLAVEDNRNALEKANAELLEWLESDAGKAVTQSFDTVMSGMGSIFSQVSSIVQAELEMQTAAIEKRYDKEISQAEGNSYKVAKLEKQKEKEIAKAKNEANKKMFAMQVIQAVAQTAQNAINAYGSAAAIPVVGFVMAPIAAAMAVAAGALQIAAIKKQQQASESQGYAKGGFTKPGAVNEPAGIVHAGEWVASQRLLANPQARAMIETLDYAQRTNTIGSLRSADVSRSIRANDSIARLAEGDNGTALLTAAVVQMSRTASDLNTRLNEPFVTINTVSGDHGIKRAQDEYSKLIANKTSKSKRKNATNN